MVNLKICGKITAIQLERCILRKDSNQVPNLECYAESFCLFTSCGILGGKFQVIIH